MGRFSMDEAEHYGGQGGGGFFSLKNDKECKQVRFMYDNPDQITGYVVHEVMVDGRKRYVNCLRSYNEPVDNCPFCKNGKLQQPKYFIPLYDIERDKVVFWERGKKFGAQLAGLIKRTPNLVSQVFEIERNGKPGDTQTTYNFFTIGQPDNTKLTDLPEIPEVIGGIILDKTEAELNSYLTNGVFPYTNDNAQNGVQRNEYPQRRTPATTRQPVVSDSDKF